MSQPLTKGLGFVEALSIIAGRIIGSGIFRTPGAIFIVVCGLDLNSSSQVDITALSSLKQLSIGLFFLAWIIGGLATYLGALCYAELVALLPRSGGPYQYLKAAYPEVVTFLRGWAMFFVSETASIVAVAFIFGEYGVLLYKQITGVTLPSYVHALAPFALIWLFTFANCFGIAISGIVQNIFSFLKVFALLMMSVIFLGVGGDSSNLHTHFWPKEWSWGIVLGLGQAMRYTFFAYSGWEGATYVAEEVRGARKKLPLSLFVGIASVAAIYLIVNLGYVVQLGPLGIIQSRKHIAAAAMEHALGLGGTILLAALVMLSTSGNVSTQILVKARTWYAMARDGLFFKPMAKLHDRYQTPNAALVGQAMWASMLLYFSFFFENSYEALIDFFSFTSTLFNLLTFASVAILRYKMPQARRSFRVPYLPFVLGLVMLIQIWFLLVTLYDRPLESFAGLALTFSGLVYYFYMKR